MKIEVFVGSNGDWYWHFRAKNGRVTADAEAYASKANAIRAAKAVVKGVMQCCDSGYLVKFSKTRYEPNTDCYEITWQ